MTRLEFMKKIAAGAALPALADEYKMKYDGCLGLELANAFPANPQWIDELREYFTSLM